jgi:cell division protein FtsQ
MSPAASAAARRPVARRRPLAARFARPRRSRVIAVLLALAALAAGYWFWFRDSSLVAVHHVEVVGVTIGERDRISSELTDLAEKMTTLDVDTAKLESAAKAYPTVDSIDVDADFPHGLRIEVTERPPVMVVTAGSKRVAVAADGTLLPDVEVPDGGLPTLELKKQPPPGGLEGAAADQAVIAGAAPEPLRPLMHTIEHTADHGIVVTLRGGIPVYFGTAAAAAQKWTAAAAVLADPKLQALTYLDVRVPGRPAAGAAAESQL